MSAEVGFALRAPWYVRERGKFGLRDARALRPEIQMYDNPQFVKRLLADPRDSLAFDEQGDDVWSYPVPVAFGQGQGRERFATSRLIHTGLRKLYQPNHSRFYAVTIEVFCDLPGLPRAGAHDDTEVGFVMRRRHTVVTGAKDDVRRLARDLTVALAKVQHPQTTLGSLYSDVEQVLWADLADRRKFEDDHSELLSEVEARTEEQAWIPGPAGGQWLTVDTPPAVDPSHGDEQQFPMWRLPPRKKDCAAAQTRSLWFGLVPTYSADSEPDGGPKLDDHGIYELRCFVRKPPGRDREHCPPKIWWSHPSRSFALAAPYDPEGTKNHRVNITMPDFRALVARAAKPLGPGAVRIVTPPGSQLLFDSDNGSPKNASVGGTGNVCFYAFELFVIVSFFVFLLFLPVVIFLFQLWWMLALRFCLPPSLSFDLLAKFFADGHVLSDLSKPEFKDQHDALDKLLGNDGAADTIVNNPDFVAHPDVLPDLVTAVHVTEAAIATPPPPEDQPDDPVCPT